MTHSFRVFIAIKRQHGHGNSNKKHSIGTLATSFRDSFDYPHDREHGILQIKGRECAILITGISKPIPTLTHFLHKDHVHSNKATPSNRASAYETMWVNYIQTTTHVFIKHQTEVSNPHCQIN